MKRIAIRLIVMCALAVFATHADAQIFGGYGYGGGAYGYGGGAYGNGGYGNGGYGGRGFGGGQRGARSSYFGNGGHDLEAHEHVTQTPFGRYSWYGTAPHDQVPHQHSRTPWSYEGYSDTAAGPTTSYYNQQPNYYAPW